MPVKCRECLSIIEEKLLILPAGEQRYACCMLYSVALIGLFLLTLVKCRSASNTHYLNLKVFGRRLEIPRSRGIALAGIVDTAAEKLRSLQFNNLDFSSGAVWVSSSHQWEEYCSTETLKG